MIRNLTFPVTCHTNHVALGSTFVAIQGYQQNGEHYIEQAIAKGATTIVVDSTCDIEKLQRCYPNVTFTATSNTRQALAELSAQALGHPAQQLTILGITGSKGKSSTTHLVHHLLTSYGYKTALLSGIKNKIGDQEDPSMLTTPESDYIQMFLRKCVDNTITHVVMEVSSHALSLHRTHGITFTAAAFTNLAPEHADFYPTMQEYFDAKYLLFNQLVAHGTVVINGDDPWGKQAYKQLQQRHPADCLKAFYQTPAVNDHQPHFTIKQNSPAGITVELNTQQGQLTLHSSLLFGEFNAYNLCTAALLAQACNIPAQIIENAIASFPGTPGRLQQHILKNGARAFVDYAHHAPGTLAILKTLRPLTSHLIVIFGCGGGKDPSKRPAIAKLAEQYADIIIITNDNPRNEDPQAILRDIQAGFKNPQAPHIFYELDRKKAIKLAVQNATPDSIIALLGKGHEDYYLVKGVKHYFNDYQEIQQY